MYSPDSTQRVLSQLQLVRGAAPGARVLLRGLQQLQHPDEVVLSRYSTLSASLSVPDEAPAPGGLVAEAAGGEGGAGEDVVQGRRFVRRPGGCRRFVRRPGGGHGGAGEAVVVQVGGHEGVLGLALVTRPLQVRACRRRYV